MHVKDVMSGIWDGRKNSGVASRYSIVMRIYVQMPANTEIRLQMEDTLEIKEKRCGFQETLQGSNVIIIMFYSGRKLPLVEIIISGIEIYQDANVSYILAFLNLFELHLSYICNKIRLLSILNDREHCLKRRLSSTQRPASWEGFY